MTHRLGSGKKVRIEFGSIIGLWDEAEKVITDESLKGCEFLETFLHEILHAECPRLSEKDVDRTANSQARALWAIFRGVKRGRK
jgi:hypothetical protein